MSEFMQITLPRLTTCTQGLSHDQATALSEVLAFLEQVIDPYVPQNTSSPAALWEYYCTLTSAASQEPLLTVLADQPCTGANLNAGFPMQLASYIEQELDLSLGPQAGDSSWFQGFSSYFQRMANTGALTSGMNIAIGLARQRSVRHFIFGHQPQTCFTILAFRWFMSGMSPDEQEAMQACYLTLQRQMMAGWADPDLMTFLSEAPRNCILFSGMTFGYTRSEWHHQRDRIHGLLSAQSREAIQIAPLGA